MEIHIPCMKCLVCCGSEVYECCRDKITVTITSPEAIAYASKMEKRRLFFEAVEQRKKELVAELGGSMEDHHFTAYYYVSDVLKLQY